MIAGRYILYKTGFCVYVSQNQVSKTDDTLLNLKNSKYDSFITRKFE